MSNEVMFAREDEMEALNVVDDGVDSQKYLIFMAAHLKLGVIAEDVVEILNNQVITYLPMVPGFIRGIINMRGQMIPILDIRARLGMAEGRILKLPRLDPEHFVLPAQKRDAVPAVADDPVSEGSVAVAVRSLSFIGRSLRYLVVQMVCKQQICPQQYHDRKEYGRQKLSRPDPPVSSLYFLWFLRIRRLHQL